METLKDIKPLVSIPDNSLIYLLIMLAVVLLILLIFGRYIWQNQMIKRRNNDRKIALKALKELDFSNSKSTAYIFSAYASALVNETNAAEFEKINTALLTYKYKKQVGKLDAMLIAQIEAFVNV
ncbi:hypothetical protein [Bathymodiolus septemdierum thioautotrophic gill symbiont]|uniref:DUF4381 domain-containing protein n=1 Tax=endosymbiont of Bathymodiolus septemdierum str. Myojin knoll TaxID=1303921 RepID=A0A0N7KBF5_9GAMM|nr:hypothetical protein [Bathymodiolus septemdierum thioautotrophic gill symbiont]BAS67871.1 conserved hypothetical protein [endosymbiont of Bathymodiolus septemdierum str. Myojin knoll]